MSISEIERKIEEGFMSAMAILLFIAVVIGPIAVFGLWWRAKGDAVSEWLDALAFRLFG